MKKTAVWFLAFALVIVFQGCKGESATTQADVSLDTLLEAIREPYGEDYLPNMEMTMADIENEFGITGDMVEEARGENPMIGTHPDRVVVVKAKPGQADAVEDQFNAVRERKIQDELQYPMNIAKVNAAQVARQGDYVAFLLVGAPGDMSLDPESEEAAEFARSETQKGVDAFLGAF